MFEQFGFLVSTVFMLSHTHSRRIIQNKSLESKIILLVGWVYRITSDLALIPNRRSTLYFK